MRSLFAFFEPFMEWLYPTRKLFKTPKYRPKTAREAWLEDEKKLREDWKRVLGRDTYDTLDIPRDDS